MSVVDRRRRLRRREVIVFTEGEVTEAAYVDSIKRLQQLYAVRVDDRHGGPATIVALAIDTLRERDEAGAAEGLPENERAIVWCLFDRDEHRGIPEAMRSAQRQGVRVALSNPCFELWLLLHFVDHGAPAGGRCRGVTDQLDHHLRGYKRRGKRVSADDLSGRLAVARQRAMRLEARHDGDGVLAAIRRDPSTTVFAFVDTIDVEY